MGQHDVHRIGGYPSRQGWADDPRWSALSFERRVLIVIHTLTGATRLRTAAELISRDDDRVQVLFTQAPDRFGQGVGDFLKAIGAKVVLWDDAIREDFDLAIAAGYGDIHRLRAPVVVMPHGAGHHKLVSRTPGVGRPVAREVYGYDRQRLTHDGRVTPTVVVLSHTEQIGLLAASCVEAVSSARVVGDPCCDELSKVLPRRPEIRRELGVTGGRKLVVVTSTWGGASLHTRRPDLLRRIMDELPAETYRVMAVLHPNIWAELGEFQIRQQYAEALSRGLILVPPDDDWLVVIAAADWVIGDHGSVTLYATASQATVVLGAFGHDDVAPGSPPEQLARAAPFLDLERPLEAQLRAAAALGRRHYEHIASRITSEPGSFAVNFRRLVYELLGLHDPP